jgi:DNA-binding MarR family transcriptional regulator
MSQKQKLQTPSAEAFTQLILETFRFNGRLLTAGDRLTKELGLSSALWQMLGAIDQAPLTVAQIARNMGLTRQSVRRTAHVLREKGFIEFQENPNHQRAKFVVLTKPGSNVLDRATKIQIDWSNRIAQDLNAPELNAAMQIIRTLCERL